MGCRFEFRAQKLPYERISGNFSDFTDFGHQVRVCKKRSPLILAVIQKIWDLHKFGLQIWIQNVKITLWKNFGHFFDFIDFGHQVRVCKKDHISILSVILKIWDLHKFGQQIWIYPMKKFRTIFPVSSILVIRSMYAKKVQVSILAVFQNICDLHKFGLQIWIQSAKITLWKNFGQFFRFHRFWSSGPGMQKQIISQY